MKLRILVAVILFPVLVGYAQQKFITKNGNITFFSHTPVEDIKAENNQVLAIINSDTEKIAISLLIKAFHFKKALMQEHFNENYMDSNQFPKATFKGKIIGLNSMDDSQKSIVIEGNLTLKDKTHPISVEAKIQKNETIQLQGSFIINVKDYNIKIPSVVSKNIAEEIQVMFLLDFKPL